MNKKATLANKVFKDKHTSLFRCSFHILRKSCIKKKTVIMINKTKNYKIHGLAHLMAKGRTLKLILLQFQCQRKKVLYRRQ